MVRFRQSCEKFIIPVCPSSGLNLSKCLRALKLISFSTQNFYFKNQNCKLSSSIPMIRCVVGVTAVSHCNWCHNCNTVTNNNINILWLLSLEQLVWQSLLGEATKDQYLLGFEANFSDTLWLHIEMLSHLIYRFNIYINKYDWL